MFKKFTVAPKGKQSFEGSRDKAEILASIYWTPSTSLSRSLVSSCCQIKQLLFTFTLSAFPDESPGALARLQVIWLIQDHTQSCSSKMFFSSGSFLGCSSTRHSSLPAQFLALQRSLTLTLVFQDFTQKSSYLILLTRGNIFLLFYCIACHIMPVFHWIIIDSCI